MSHSVVDLLLQANVKAVEPFKFTSAGVTVTFQLPKTSDDWDSYVSEGQAFVKHATEGKMSGTPFEQYTPCSSVEAGQAFAVSKFAVEPSIPLVDALKLAKENHFLAKAIVDKINHYSSLSWNDVYAKAESEKKDVGTEAQDTA